MYAKFTDRARAVMHLANQEAQRFNHEYIGIEHLLLALIKEGHGVAAYVLKRFGLNLTTVRVKVESSLGAGPDIYARAPKLPSTPNLKKIVELAMAESTKLGHTYIGTEHLLLGLMRLQDTIVTHILANLGIKPEDVIAETLVVLGHEEDIRKQAGDAILDLLSPATIRALAALKKLRQLLQLEKIEQVPEVALQVLLGKRPLPSEPTVVHENPDPDANTKETT